MPIIGVLAARDARSPSEVPESRKSWTGGSLYHDEAAATGRRHPGEANAPRVSAEKARVLGHCSRAGC